MTNSRTEREGRDTDWSPVGRSRFIPRFQVVNRSTRRGGVSQRGNGRVHTRGFCPGGLGDAPIEGEYEDARGAVHAAAAGCGGGHKPAAMRAVRVGFVGVERARRLAGRGCRRELRPTDRKIARRKPIMKIRLVYPDRGRPVTPTRSRPDQGRDPTASRPPSLRDHAERGRERPVSPCSRSPPHLPDRGPRPQSAAPDPRRSPSRTLRHHRSYSPLRFVRQRPPGDKTRL